MRISVIIPVYNAAKYLRECIDSVLNQKLERGDSLEIIAIDNNSTDNSLDILHEYKNIKVLTCEKKGAAAVRNYGIREATGDFVWFIDSDDMVAEGSLPKLIKIAKTGVDLVNYQVERFYDATGERESLLKAIDLSKKDWQHTFVRYGFGAWSFLIRREWFLEHELFFHEGIICEDVGIMSAYILYTDKIGVLDEVGYRYRQRVDSVSHPKQWGKESYDVMVALADLVARFKKERADKKYAEDLEEFFIWHLPIDFINSVRGYERNAKREAMRRMRKMMREYFPKWRKNRYLKAKGIKTILRARLGYWGLC